MAVRNFLLKVIEKITHHPRYHPEDYELDGRIHWSNNVWVSNIFRFYEYLFGRGFGIRAEVSTSVSYQDGKLCIKREFYTVEALVSHIEITFREYLFFYKTLFCSMPLNYQATSVTFVIFGFVISFHAPQHLLPLFGLAIAFDATAISTSQSATPLIWNHTCTGSNGMIAIGVGVQSTSSGGGFATTAVTYNSVSATKARSDHNTTWIVDSSVWLLGGPNTGSHQVSCTVSLGTGATCGGISASYSGAQSSSTADATGGDFASVTGGSNTFTVTTVSSSCWIFAFSTWYNQSTDGTNTANQTQRSASLKILSTTSNVTIAAEDTNGSVSSGSNTIGFTFGGSFGKAFAMTGASFAPAAAAFTFQQLTNTEIPRELFEKTDVVSY